MTLSLIRCAATTAVTMLLLSACGGGGSGTSSAPPPGAALPVDPAPPSPGPQPPEVVGDSRLTLSPAVLNQTLFVGEDISLMVNARGAKAFEGVARVDVVDTNGVITRIGEADVATSPDSSSVKLYINALKLAPGVYTGTIDIRLCKDNTMVCTSPLPGSSWKLPYRVEVKQADLRPLTLLPGASDWTTFQGNEKHVGFIPVTLDPARFAPRYMWTSPSVVSEQTALDHSPISSLVNHDGTVFFSSKTERLLYAIDERSGATKWTYRVPGDLNDPRVGNIGPPAVGAGKVYMGTSGNGSAGMHIVDEKTGGGLSVLPFSAQKEEYFPPTVDASGAYANVASLFGRLYKFDPTTNQQTWLAPLTQYGQWTPALDDKYAYVYFPGKSFEDPGLQILDKATGASVATIADPGALSTGSLMSAPVLYASSNLLVGYSAAVPTDGRLVNFDLSTRSVKWALNDHYMTTPVVAGSLLYVLNNDQVQARRLSDGILVWSWALPHEEVIDAGLYGQKKRKNMIATNNLLFVTAENTTYALDLVTHQPVWSYPRGGELSMSKYGVLFINTTDAHIIAITLN